MSASAASFLRENAILLPASMKLLGDWNWYLPRWLEWLPRMEHEAVAEPEEDERAAGLEVTVRATPDRVRVALAGELDLTSVDVFTGRLAEVESRAPEVIEIDLRDLVFMDSSGLAQLFAANRRARAAGRRIVILKAAGPIERVLALAKIEDAIDVIEEPS